MDLLSYRVLAWTLIARNLKIRYKGSALGFLWSLLTPLAMIFTYAIFAGVLGMKRTLLGTSGGLGVEYLPFLVSGIVVWQFTAGTLSDSLYAIVGNANLVKKVYFPRVILPASTALANGINFLLTFLILLLYLGVSGSLRLGTATLWLLPALLLHLALCIGIATFISTVNVFYRDTEHLIGIVQLAWFFMTPVMYEQGLQLSAMEHFPWFDHSLDFLPFLNPMSGLLSLYRAALMGMDIAPPHCLAASAAVVVAVLVLGLTVLRSGNRRFGDVL